MGAGMLRGWLMIWNMELMVLLAAVVLLLCAIAVVEVVASAHGMTNRRTRNDILLDDAEIEQR